MASIDLWWWPGMEDKQSVYAHQASSAGAKETNEARVCGL